MFVVSKDAVGLLELGGNLGSNWCLRPGHCPRQGPLLFFILLLGKSRVHWMQETLGLLSPPKGVVFHSNLKEPLSFK